MTENERAELLRLREEPTEEFLRLGAEWVEKLWKTCG